MVATCVIMEDDVVAWMDDLVKQKKVGSRSDLIRQCVNRMRPVIERELRTKRMRRT